MLTYLALGDSYTIGEQLPLYECFPYQVVQLLRNKGIGIYAPEIIAKTGWTTDELSEKINNTCLLQQYDIVTLLIGVNNQYRGRSTDDFKEQFKMLLKSAIAFTGGDVKKVFVLSIPDWGLTPFAKDRDTAKITAEINIFNQVCKDESQTANTHFISITGSQSADAADLSFIAADGLHPSGKEYAKWAVLLADAIENNII